MKITLDLQGNTLTYENDVVSDLSQMGHAFGDGKEGNEFCYARTWQDFIGRAFHLIQQTGGILKLNGQQISAVTFADSNGNSVTQDTIVMFENGKTLTLFQMLR
jgi:hypothetical protein